jgi:glycosyltransferase involved in cell wall biosynthesis
MKRLSRIVTCHHQWDWIPLWLETPGLFVPEVEWIIVNDAPSDPCPPDLEPVLLGRGVRVFAPPVNVGRSAARNLGAERASGAWIEHVDGDDRPLPFPLPSLAAAETAGARLVLYPELEYTERSPAPHLSNPWPSWKPGDHTYWGFLFPEFAPVNPHPAGTAWLRSAYLGLGGYDARVSNGEDLHLLWRAGAAGMRALHWPEPKQAYLVHPGTSVRGRAHTYQHHETLLWLRARATGKVARQLDLLIGRQLLYNVEYSLRECGSKSGPLLAYLRAKLAGTFSGFNR